MIGRGRGLLLALERKKRDEQEHQPSSESSFAPPTVAKGRASILLREAERTRTSLETPTVSSSLETSVEGKGGTNELASLEVLLGLKSHEDRVSSYLADEASRIYETAKPVSEEELRLSQEAEKAIMYLQDRPAIKKQGTGGKIVDVTANYVRLKVEENKGVFHYLVTFDPPVDFKDERFRLLSQHREILGHARTFDGAKLFLPFLLPNQVTNVTSFSELSQSNVNLSIIFKKRLTFSDPECLSLFNILFRKIMMTLKMCQMNRNFYNPGSAMTISSRKLEIWPGYVTCVAEYEGGLQLQCDTSHRVLRSETAMDVIRDLKRPGSNFKEDVEKALIGAVVLTRYNNKFYRIDDIDWNSNVQSQFTGHGGEKISYFDYYKTKYGLKIDDVGQPLLCNLPKVTKGQRTPGSIALVPSLCYLTGLTDTMRSDRRVMKDIAAVTRVTPEQRQESLKKFIEAVVSNPEAKSHLTSWGLKIALDPVKLKGRILESSILRFGGDEKERVDHTANWSRSVSNKKVLTPVAVEKWGLIYHMKSKIQASNFIMCYQHQASRMGISISDPLIKIVADESPNAYAMAIREVAAQELQIIVVIVTYEREDRYNTIKRLCYIEHPVASQVINQKTISDDRKLVSVVQKIALQINCKLGGELWAATIPKRQLMVVGIDAYHDPLRKSKSVAGLVSSLNSTMSRWYSKAIMQRQGQELMDGIKVIMTDALVKYKDINQVWPESVIVYRDGIGDSQMEVSAKHEITQIKSAFKQVHPTYDPSFTFVVVQKRIHTRIFSMNRKTENPMPGTVVDSVITRKYMYDFFLVSQKVGEGTVSPSHYVVLEEGKDTNPDFIQRLSYVLTHMYYNWPGTVRVPAPCQYAHKLAYMVGEHLKATPSPSLQDKLFYL